MVQAKVKCPECKEMIEIDINDVEENDPFDCPECFEQLIVKIKGGKVKLITEKQKYFDESLSEFDEEDD